MIATLNVNLILTLVRLKIIFAILPILLLNFHWVDWNVVKNIEDHSHGYRVFEHNLDLQEIVPLSKKSTYSQPTIHVRSFARIEPDVNIEKTEYLSFINIDSECNPIRVNPQLSNIPPPLI
ncbi:MAG: hypothetical protein JJT78_08345 [Leptospira sp.]|nr:hypothetical protein [Leptospira sp.]